MQSFLLLINFDLFKFSPFRNMWLAMISKPKASLLEAYLTTLKVEIFDSSCLRKLANPESFSNFEPSFIPILYHFVLC